MSAAIDFVGDVGETIILGDCLAEGEVLMRSGGELLNAFREYGLDCGDGESIVARISRILIKLSTTTTTICER